jgi:septal ring factor EnvC (AmiA/AmiB activator)
MKIADLDLDKESSKRTPPKERIPMIKEVFELVLKREPTSRELSFYKYGIQEREEIIEKLLEDKEHEDNLKNSKKVPKLEDKVKEAEHKVVQLTQQIKDLEEESKQIRDLLDEKNKEIAILRREKNDPYNFTHADALKYIKGLNESNQSNVSSQSQQSPSDTHFSSINASESTRKKTFLDKVYELIRN